MTSTASLPAYLSPGVSVCQPNHLEGDSHLATEILPGPPSVASVQQSVQKRDPRKPSIVYSYLPSSDPGSTYSGIMHGTLIGQEASLGSSKRSRVDKATVAGRAQRATARSQLGTIPVIESVVTNEVATSPPVPPFAADSDYTMVMDDELTPSRSNSSQNILEESSAPAGTNGKSRRRDKGKGKETDVSGVKIKEEPKAISLQTPEPIIPQFPNQDHCSSCRSTGGLVYCDGCPRAFHLWCLDPPMENVEEMDSKWYCPACTIRKHPPRRPAPSLLSPLIHLVETSIPTEFQLPEDIRSTFKDVATGERGSYVDASELKPPRLNRQGQLEDRDAHRLRDRNGQPVLCFRCGTSALPEGVAAAAPATKRARRATEKAIQHEAWKNIISCDHCDLHWHLDCLDPPLSSVPSFTKKWMCPNHVEQVLPSRRRVPKQNASHPIEITDPRQFNNGNIEVIPSESASTAPPPPKFNVEEVLINGRRYRVPERIILLDFWNKIGRNVDVPVKDAADVSRLSSPLTSLSSLEELDDSSPPFNGGSEELKVAQMLCDLRLGRNSKNVPPEVVPSRAPSPPPKSRRVKIIGKDMSRKLPNPSIAKGAFSSASAPVTAPVASTSALTNANKRRKIVKTDAATPLESSTRELRSKIRQDSVSSRDVEIASLSAPVPSVSRRVRVKMEEPDIGLPLLNGTVAAPPSTKPAPRRSRPTKRPKHFDEDDDKTEKRGQKRKQPDDDTAYVDRSSTMKAKAKAKESASATETREKDKKKGTRTPSRVTTLSSVSSSTFGSSTSATTPGPTTPSLKIRLPPLNLHNSPTRINNSRSTGS